MTRDTTSVYTVTDCEEPGTKVSVSLVSCTQILFMVTGKKYIDSLIETWKNYQWHIIWHTRLVVNHNNLVCQLSSYTIISTQVINIPSLEDTCAFLVNLEGATPALSFKVRSTPERGRGNEPPSWKSFGGGAGAALTWDNWCKKEEKEIKSSLRWNFKKRNETKTEYQLHSDFLPRPPPPPSVPLSVLSVYHSFSPFSRSLFSSFIFTSCLTSSSSCVSTHRFVISS